MKPPSAQRSHKEHKVNINKNYISVFTSPVETKLLRGKNSPPWSPFLLRKRRGKDFSGELYKPLLFFKEKGLGMSLV
jgi:hypothetical protein